MLGDGPQSLLPPLLLLLEGFDLVLGHLVVLEPVEVPPDIVEDRKTDRKVSEGLGQRLREIPQLHLCLNQRVDRYRIDHPAIISRLDMDLVPVRRPCPHPLPLVSIYLHQARQRPCKVLLRPEQRLCQ